MIDASLRTRLQRCRGELSQLAGIARDAEREGGRYGAAPGWRAEGYAGESRRQVPGPELFRRFQEVTDRCAALLSEIEREVATLGPVGGRAGYATEAGFQGGWEREPAQRSTGWEAPRGSGYFAPPSDHSRVGGGWDRSVEGALAGRTALESRGGYGRDFVTASGRTYPRY